MRRNVADVKKYLREDTTGDEQVAEDDSSDENNTGRITEPQGRTVTPPDYSEDYEVYELKSETLLNTLISFTEHSNETRVRSTLPAQKDTLLNILISFALEAY